MATAISPIYQHEVVREKFVTLIPTSFVYQIEPPTGGGIISPVTGQLFPFLYLFILMVSYSKINSWILEQR